MCKCRVKEDKEVVTLWSYHMCECDGSVKIFYRPWEFGEPFGFSSVFTDNERINWAPHGPCLLCNHSREDTFWTALLRGTRILSFQVEIYIYSFCYNFVVHLSLSSSVYQKKKKVYYPLFTHVFSFFFFWLM